MREFRAVRAGEVQSAESTDEQVVVSCTRATRPGDVEGATAAWLSAACALWQVRGRHPMLICYNVAFREKRVSPENTYSDSIIINP